MERFTDYKDKLARMREGLEFDKSCKSLVKLNKEGKWVLTKDGKRRAAGLALGIVRNDFDGNLEELREQANIRLVKLRQEHANISMSEEQRAFWKSAERSTRIRVRKAERLIALDRMVPADSLLGQAADHIIRATKSERQIINELDKYNEAIETELSNRKIDPQEIKNKIRESCDIYLAKALEKYGDTVLANNPEKRTEDRNDLINKALNNSKYKSIDHLVTLAINSEKMDHIFQKFEEFDQKVEKLANNLKEFFESSRLVRYGKMAVSLLGLAIFAASSVRAAEYKIAESFEPDNNKTTLPFPSLKGSERTHRRPKPIIKLVNEITEKKSYPEFGIRAGSSILDLSQPFTIVFGNGYMDYQAQPTANSNINQVVDCNQILLDPEGWKSRPNLACVIETGYEGRKIVMIHMGDLKNSPPKVITDPEWLGQWQEANPGKDSGEVQEFKLGGQYFVDNKDNLVNQVITIKDNKGNSIQMKIVEVSVVSNIMAVDQNPENKAFISLSRLGVSVWSQDGLTISTCFNWDRNKREFTQKLLISMVPAENQDMTRTDKFTNDATELQSIVNTFIDKHTPADPEKLDTYIKKSDWYKNLPQVQKANIEPMLRQIGNYTWIYSDPESGNRQALQCIFWEGLLANLGDTGSPKHNLAGAGTEVKYPGDVLNLPEYSGFTPHYSKKVNLNNLEQGDILITKYHTGVVIKTEIVNGVTMVTIADANRNADGKVRIETISSAKELEGIFGTIVWFE